MLDANVRWILSFYRTSEIVGALFFGELARRTRASGMQQALTRHFSDEAQHARYWTDCLAGLGAEPMRLGESYQDRYLKEAGLPANFMEVLAVTHAFERRVMGQYTRHMQIREIQPEIRQTLVRIVVDERRHLRWVRGALREMEKDYGATVVRRARERFEAADERVYRKLIAEHGDRMEDLFARDRAGGGS